MTVRKYVVYELIPTVERHLINRVFNYLQSSQHIDKHKIYAPSHPETLRDDGTDEFATSLQ